MFLRHFRRFERCSYQFIESVKHTARKCEKTRSGVAWQRTPSFELKNEQPKTKLFILFFWCFQSYLFNYTTTERLHSLAATSSWLKSVKWWSVFRTPARVIKALTIKASENIKIIHPASTHEHWVGFKLWTTSINDLGSVFFEWRITTKKNHVISYAYFGERWLWILLGYYLERLQWKGRWGDRRIRRKGYSVTLGQGCWVSNSL